MASPASKAISSLVRYRPAILAVTAIAAGLVLYTISNDTHPLPSTSNQSSTTTLHRSNAQRRRRGRRRPHTGASNLESSIDPERIVLISYEQKYHNGQRVFGKYVFITGDNSRHEVWLSPSQLPSVSHMREEWDVNAEEASSIRQNLEVEMLESFFSQEMPPGAPRELNRLCQEKFVVEFTRAGQISATNVQAVMNRYVMGDLQDHPARPAPIDATEEPQIPGTAEQLSSEDLSAVFQILENARDGEPHNDEVVAETESNRSFDTESEDLEKPSQDQNLMNLLYRIAEDQSKKEGFIHRGVTCNSCNAMPIRGIRYRCTNCRDYDLCEQCEALQVHDKTHLFYKIRVPAPFLGNPRQPTPVWYPGKDGKADRSLTPELKMFFSTSTGIQDRQVDAYWEQFQCLAGSHYSDDPHGFNVAIDRESFDHCFVPNTTPRPPPPNLVYDRMFSFYDTNDDGFIGFAEFLSGIACIANNGKELRSRIFRAYDVDGDGYVDRKDFLRMFKANYALIKELTKQLICTMEDEFFDEDEARELIAGGQPLSSIFSGAIPRGRFNDGNLGKTENRNGDMIVYDGQGATEVAEQDDIYGVPRHGDDIVMDNAEFARFGSRDPPWIPGIPRLTLETDDDDWPKWWINSQDVEEALGRVAEPNTIEDRIDRSLVICAGQERAQQDRWIREAFRRRTITDRWQAREFYLDGESMTEPPWASVKTESLEDKDSASENDLCSLRIKALERNEEPQFIEGYREDIRREVRERWPDYPDLAKIPDQFSTWIRERYKWHKLAEALAPTRSDIPEATVAVRRIMQDCFNVRKFVTPGRALDAQGAPPFSPTSFILRENAKEVQEREANGQIKTDSQSTSPRRTPSPIGSPDVKPEQAPSEVANLDKPSGDDEHEALSTTSVSSRSLAESPGGHSNKKSTYSWKADVGREVIYQVTQEGMNELLDPMLRLREDLAIEVRKTKNERELRKNEIDERMGNGFAQKIMTLFGYYQRRWYQSPREEYDMLIPSQSINFVTFILHWFEKSEYRDSFLGIGQLDNAGQTDSATLQEVTEAIMKLDQSVANAIQGECSSSTKGQPQLAQTTVDMEPNESSDVPVPALPTTAIELHEGVTIFDEADTSIEDSTKRKPLELLLADAGYGVITPPVEDLEIGDASTISSLESNSVEGLEGDRVDPTLPHNRPNSISEWETKYGTPRTEADIDETVQRLAIRSEPGSPEPEKLPPLSAERLLILAVWNVIEEDDQARGGSGRLNLHDYELIMEGDKGQALGFLGNWVETAAF
ncbi:MAG: hypothetical protein Q9219_001837 [cf. Caloplaca sp. 3 TL-2023]